MIERPATDDVLAPEIDLARPFALFVSFVVDRSDVATEPVEPRHRRRSGTTPLAQRKRGALLRALPFVVRSSSAAGRTDHFELTSSFFRSATISSWMFPGTRR
ncbi:MAG TPA: hypothetical protein DCQ98_13655 [Planctomycetaceae bacterium]|nr:hypothetical protein [Planctomycetaceae bacterium]